MWGKIFLKGILKKFSMLDRRYLKNLIRMKSKIIDIGAGNGEFALWLHNVLRCEVVAIDVFVNDSHTVFPVKKFNGINIDYADQSFDYSIFNFVLHHIADKDLNKVPKEAKKISKQIIIIEDFPIFSLKVWEAIYSFQYN